MQDAGGSAGVVGVDCTSISSTLKMRAFTAPVEQTDARKEPGLPHWLEEKRWQPIDDGYSQ